GSRTVDLPVLANQLKLRLSSLGRREGPVEASLNQIPNRGPDRHIDRQRAGRRGSGYLADESLTAEVDQNFGNGNGPASKEIAQDRASSRRAGLTREIGRSRRG